TVDRMEPEPYAVAEVAGEDGAPQRDVTSAERLETHDGLARVRVPTEQRVREFVGEVQREDVPRPRFLTIGPYRLRVGECRLRAVGLRDRHFVDEQLVGR